MYLYNGHDTEDASARFCEEVEAKALPDRKVIRAGRGFTCEKICYGCEEFGYRFPSRSVIEGYLDSLRVDPEKVTARIVLLDSGGQVLAEFTKPPTAAALLRAMLQATEENRSRFGATER